MNNDNFDEFLDELYYAWDNVPFYKKHLQKANVCPDDIESLVDVKKIPYTEKKDYRKNFPVGVVAKGYSLKDEHLTRSQSSGTAGDRLVTFEVGMLLLGRAMECVGVYPEVETAFTSSPRKIVRYAAPNCSDVECANPNSTQQDRMLSDGTLVLPVYHDLLTTSDVLIDRALAEICDFEPDLYYVDPTHFAFLLRQAKKRNKRLPKAPVITTYTATNPLNSQQIKSIFSEFGFDDINFAQLVSSSEMGWLAMECQQGHLHLNTDAYFMELLKDGKDVQPGEVGELYITSLDNGAIPHLRYRTGDAFEYLGDECPCGYHTPIAKMAGRLSDFLVVNGQPAMPPFMVNDAIGAPAWLDMYQLTQQSEQDIQLKLMVNDQYQTDDEQSIIAQLKTLLGEDKVIKAEKVPYIETERSGKFQCVRKLITP